MSENDDKLMRIEDFPKEVVKDMWAIVKNKGKDNEEFIYAYPTEIEALRVGCGFRNKTVFKTNIVFYNVCGLKVMGGYED